ncbi:MAG: SCO family protein [Chthoniobacterales bacterium]|nr:SCO family protein [Chthoniobacterales bacterium]
MTSSEPRRFSTLSWILLFFLAALLVGGAFISFRKGESRTHFSQPPIAEVPDFSFLTQEGKKCTKADLLGKVWVADFIFTRCQGPCPLMTARMAELASKLKKSPDVQLVSVTIDPTYDTPEVLAAYAAAIHADPAQWIFLTGELDKIASFTQQGMKQPLAFDSNGTPNHSTRLMIVDKNGMIRSYHDANDPEVIQKTLLDVGSLLRDSKNK